MIAAVIGAGYGDEGKGLITDSLCHQQVKHGRKVWNVRFNGGAQAGHTVVTPGGTQHVFHHFGAGTLAGAETYWSSFCPFNPIQLLAEHRELREKVHDERRDSLLIHADPDCPVTTPWDMAVNQQDKANLEHGTCGLGIHTTAYRTKNGPKLHLRDLQDFWDGKGGLLPKLADIARYYGKNLGQDWVTEFVRAVARCERITHVEKFENVFDHDEDLVFEGAQGLKLHEGHENFPHVTHSKTGIENVMDFVRSMPPYAGKREINAFYVSRTYSTRHGNGPFPEGRMYIRGERGNEETPQHRAYPYRKMHDCRTNVRNKWQGDMRYGVLNLTSLLSEVRRDLERERNKLLVRPHFALTHCDSLTEGRVHYTEGDLLKSVEVDVFAARVAEDIGGSGFVTSWGPTRETVS